MARSRDSQRPRCICIINTNPHPAKVHAAKPSTDTLASLSANHFYLTDIGVWILSDRAVRTLMQRSVTDGDIEKGQIDYYDLYGTFGCALGTDPGVKDEEISKLKVAILPLPGGEFYHSEHRTNYYRQWLTYRIS